MIDEEGLEHVSIRKIAEKAGFHNSTIYLYFKDLNQLIMLASIKYFREYSHALGEQSQKHLPAKEQFLSIWGLFADSIFKKSHIYYHFFFGKHSDDLRDIMNMYYDIFPEELETFTDEIETMYFGANIKERCLNILKPLLKEDTSVTKDNLLMVNDIIISYCKYLLEQKCSDGALDSTVLKKQLLDGISYITGISDIGSLN